jgi:hypothetical protein
MEALRKTFPENAGQDEILGALGIFHNTPRRVKPIRLAVWPAAANIQSRL